MAQCEATYKIQVGSWTKLPYGKVQKDTRAIVEMMAGEVGGEAEDYNPRVGFAWSYLGITSEDEVVFFDDKGFVNVRKDTKLFIPYKKLQSMLPLEPTNKITSLFNTKLDCRKPDGTIDVELSKAFQEACFEQGIKWIKFDSGYHHLDKHFLYANDKYISFSNKEFVTDDLFKNHKNKQINFTYSRKLEWEATVVEPFNPDEIVTIGGVAYSAKELKEALELSGKAKK